MLGERGGSTVEMAPHRLVVISTCLVECVRFFGGGWFSDTCLFVCWVDLPCLPGLGFGGWAGLVSGCAGAFFFLEDTYLPTYLPTYFFFHLGIYA